jgi:CBS domain-containing protein
MSIESIPVSSFMTKDVKTETEDQNIQAVCKIMNENEIGSVVIVENLQGSSNKPVGIITERDIVRIVGSLKMELLREPLRQLVSKPLITISSNSSIKDALRTMQFKNIRRLPIVEKEGDNNLVGIITEKDVFRTIMTNQNLIPSLLNDEILLGHKQVYNQFTQQWFGDILHRS